MNDFMTYTYPWIALVVFVLVLVVGVVIAVNECDDDVLLGLMVAAATAAVAGLAWPVMLLVVVIAVSAAWLRDRRESATDAAHIFVGDHDATLSDEQFIRRQP